MRSNTRGPDGPSADVIVVGAGHKIPLSSWVVERVANRDLDLEASD